MTIGIERGFALLGGAVLVVAAISVVATPGVASTDTGTIAFDPPVPDEYSFDLPARSGTATVDGHEFDSVQSAVDAAAPGDTVRLAGRFDEHVVVDVPNVTLTSRTGTRAVIDGGGGGDVLTLDRDNVTVRRVWVRNSGFDASENDAGIWVNGTGARVVDSRITAVTFGVWIDGVDHVSVRNDTVVGRESVRPLSYRGNGIQIWKSEDSLIADNRITDVRDGIYYSWASEVTARRNTMWDLRYGVHYMYSDDCRLVNNTAFDNDVGYALMVSQRLEIVNNTAVNNTGGSGHGILVKSIDRTTIRNNGFVGNEKGLYVFNSLDNVIADNLVMENRVGVQLTAGSVEEAVHGNTFIGNDRPVLAVIGQEQVSWNSSTSGNYWDAARPIDRDNDGVSEVRYRPAGLVEYLVQRHPQASVFAHSPAFDAVRLAQSSFPVIESPGVVDYYPLARPPNEGWRRYYERH